MTAIISAALWALRNWRLVGTLALVTVAAVYIGWMTLTVRNLRSENTQLEKRYEEAVGERDEALRTLDETVAFYEKAMAAVERARAETARLVNEANDIKQEIYNAPASEDAPVAPVVRRTLERLRVAPGSD